MAALGGIATPVWPPTHQVVCPMRRLRGWVTCPSPPSHQHRPADRGLPIIRCSQRWGCPVLRRTQRWGFDVVPGLVRCLHGQHDALGEMPYQSGGAIWKQPISIARGFCSPSVHIPLFPFPHSRSLIPIPLFQFGDGVIGARQPVWIDLNTPAGRVRHRNLAIGHGKGITAEQMFGPGVVIRALNGEL